MTELIRHALLSRLRSSVIWGIAVGLTSGLMLASYLAFDVDQLTQITKSLSPELQKAFNITEQSLTNPAGYLAGQFLGYAPLVLGFYAISAGSRAFAGREADRTLDLIAAQPVARWKLPLATLLATAAGLVVVLALYAVLTWLTAIVCGIDLAVGDIAASAAGLLPVSLLYGALALALSAVLRRPGAVTGICGALLVIAYLANTIALLVPDLEWLKWATPFFYYGSPIERGFDLSDQAVLLAGTAVFTLVSLWRYERRDIQA